MQNPIESSKKLIFQKVNFLTVSTLYCTGEKNHFLVLFYNAKSFSDHFTNTKLFQVFFEKLISNPILQRGVTRSHKKKFLVLFYSAKSNSDHLKTSNFSSFFRKINFFTVSTAILHIWKKWSQQKITICSLTVQKPFQTILGIQIFYQNLKKI